MMENQPLPPLRQELRLEAASPVDGQPFWRLYDPCCQRFYLLPEEDVALLALWSQGSVIGIKRMLSRAGQELDENRLAGLLGFLEQHHLLRTLTSAGHKRLWQARRRELNAFWQHGWRMVKLPLLPATPILNRLQPLLTALGHGYWLLIWSLATAIGLYFTLQQWDIFLATFSGFATVNGVIIYLLALVAVKFLHELGHAYVAAHQGVAVGRIGVALFMGLPMFYTELDQTVRLAPCQRKWVATGGVMVETLLAGLCTLIWAIFPDGVLRTLAFVIATTSWITTLAINLNPLARFDGYYFLADLLGIDNLQSRALAYARGELTRMVLGPVLSSSERLSWHRALFFLFFGTLVWLYQLVLMLGIAWLVYRYSFKALGCLLLAAGVWMFLLRPLCNLIRQWWQLRHKVELRRRLELVLLAVALLVMLFAPLDRHIHAPAVLEWSHQSKVMVPEAGRIVALSLPANGQVQRDQVLLRLTSPLLDQQLEEAQLRARLAGERLARIGGSVDERSEMQVLLQQQIQARADIEGLQHRLERLTIRAPDSGQLVDQRTNLQPGQWLGRETEIGIVLHGEERDVIALVPERQLQRLQPQSRAQFYPEDLSFSPLTAQVDQLAMSAEERLTYVELASVYGGEIPSVEDNGLLRPLSAWHRLHLNVVGKSPVDMPRLRGHITLDAQPESLAGQIGQRVWTLLMQELRQ